jgi:ATP-dependent DNA helicase RecG
LRKHNIDCIDKNPHISSVELAKIVGISSRKIEVNIAKLKDYGILERIGSPKGGYWKINQ